MNHEERMARAERANRILKDDLVVSAFNDLEAHYIKAWRGGKSMDVREDAHRYITLLEKFKAQLVAHLADGTIASRQRREIEGRKFPL